ncbi:MAG TPA: hypothetical protein VNN79_12790 [Actinomycetota bacterium]|nr:hypothetical protein [Actinomycetota bacterium]
MLKKLLLSGVVAALTVFALAAPSFGGSRAATSSGGVLLVDGDGGTPMFQLPEMAVGSPAVRCITVTNAGTRTVNARLFAHVDGRLRNALQVEVARGVAAPTNPFPGCAGFVPDPSIQQGLGTGVVYRGTVADLSGRFAKATPDPGAWAPGVTRTYRFTVTLASLPDRNRLGTTVGFVWKARGS